MRFGAIVFAVSFVMICCSCSMFLVDLIPTKPRAAMAPGASLKDLITVLGKPMGSNTSIVPANARRFQTNDPSCVCYSYRVSGLVQISGDKFTGDAELWPVVVIMTLGVAEVIAFPYVSIELAAMSLKRYELRVWYDCSDHIVAYERRRWADREKEPH